MSDSNLDESRDLYDVIVAFDAILKQKSSLKIFSKTQSSLKISKKQRRLSPDVDRATS